MDMLKGMDPETVKLYLERIPLEQSPDGSPPNFQNPPSIANSLKITVCVFLPLMLLFALLRIYAAVRVRSKFGLDDYLSLLAAISVLGFCIVELLLSNGTTPLGIHEWNIPVSKATDERYIRLTCALVVLSCIGSLLIKTTLFALYSRLFNPTKMVQAAIWFSVSMMAACYIASSICSVVFLTPKSRELIPWTIHIINAGERTRRLASALGFFNLVSDLITLIFPLALIMPLKLSHSKKIGVAAVFLVGLVACGCSLGGCIIRGLQLRISDTIYRTTLTQILGVMELVVGYMCSCMPVVAVVFKQAATSPPIRSLLNNFRSLTSKNSNDCGHLPLKEDQLDPLPRVPRAHMTGLRSFIRKIHRSEGQTTFVDTVPLDTFQGLQSVDMDYHAQLRNEPIGRKDVSGHTSPHGTSSPCG